MEGKKVGATILIVIGIAMLLYVFYQGYLLFTSVSTMDFEAPAQLTIPTPAGEIPLNIPGVGSLPILMKAIVEVMYLGVLIVVGSKIAGKGIDLLKKT
jgi:hypothetical protein